VVRISHRVSAAFAALIAVAVIVTSFVSSRATEQVLDRELSAHLATLVGIAAAGQRGDILSALRPGDEELLAYRHAVERLARLRDDARLNDAFIVNREGRLLVGLGEGARVGAERFLLHLDPVEVEQAWAGARPVGARYVARDGRPYRAAYAPVQDGRGQVVALLGVEASADYYAALRALRLRGYVVVGLSLLVAVAVAAVLGRSLLRPIQELAQVAETIGEDPSDPAGPRRRRDEFSILLASFDRLRARIRARDQELAKRADAAVARERHLGERILADLSSGVVTVEHSGQVSSFNPEARRILGAEDEATIGARLRATPALSELVRRDAPGAVEVEMQAGAGARVVSARSSTLRDENGAAMGRLIVLDDVTERRDLERRFAARETLAALGEMSAGVAHEIRNPLNGIGLLLGLLHRDLDSDPQRRMLVERAQREIDGLNVVVTEFLQFARPVELELAPIALEELVESVLILAAGELEKRRLVVRRQVPPGVTLRADAEQLKRALLNLVLNAAQASPEGTEITILGLRWDGRIRLSVRDRGGGVDPAVRDRLFTPFVTGRASGTGLGLALVQKIAQLHGGECRLDDSGPGGSIFTLELPLVAP